MQRSEGGNLSEEAEEGPLPDRRSVVVGGAALIAGIAAAGVPGSAMAEAPEKLAAQPGDRVQIVTGEFKSRLVEPGLLEVGAAPFEAFPFDPVSGVLRRGNRLNRLLVLRLEPSEMDEPTRARSAEGVLAYSALCTHRACTIKSWMPEVRHLRCHCHLSEFSAMTGGSVKKGPAMRALPMLPLKIDDEGFVTLADGFSGKVGAAKT